MNEIDTVVLSDLDAYVDNQLDAAGRLRVENYLSSHPEDAARVMADLGMRTTLKLALTDDSVHGRTETREAARRLSASLESRRTFTALRRVAAIGMLVSAGWFANSSIGPFGPSEVNASVQPPALIENAVRAHETSLVREKMPSQPEARTYDREDIRAATAIVMPELPKGWQVTDVQIFPSDYGPSVEASMRTADGVRVSLYAVRPGHFAVEPIKDMNLPKAEAAWWQIGDVAYAVVSSTTDIGLADEAELLKNSLY